MARADFASPCDETLCELCLNFSCELRRGASNGLVSGLPPFRAFAPSLHTSTCSSQVKSLVHKQQTTIRQPIECAPEASNGGRESMEMAARGCHLEVTRALGEQVQVRSRGRSRPMSATLTTKRKSARDRSASSNERVGGLGERNIAGDHGRSTGKSSRSVGAASRSPR